MKKHGFTLIEIMVVVGIIGLLATLGTLAVNKTSRNARIKTAQSELEMISAAVLQLAWDTGKWPNGQIRTTGGSSENWALTGAGCGLLDTDGSHVGWKGPYYEGEIKDPWGNSYFFDPDYWIDTVKCVVVGSLGPDGVGRNRYYNNDNIYVRVDD